jgi:hypothetical protein
MDEDLVGLRAMIASAFEEAPGTRTTIGAAKDY